jgi:hypothetical protein
MTDIEAAFERKFISAVDLDEYDKDVTVTIESVSTDERVENRDGSSTRKPIVNLVAPLQLGGPTRWPLNRTNTRVIKSLLGSGDPRVWADKSITLFKTRVFVGPEEKDAIRVRSTLPNGGAVTTTVPINAGNVLEDDLTF